MESLQKVSDYVNSQTEYINEQIHAKDDQFEEFFKHLDQLRNHTIATAAQVAESTQRTEQTQAAAQVASPPARLATTDSARIESTLEQVQAVGLEMGQVKNKVVTVEGKLEQLKFNIDEKLKMLKRQNTIDIEEPFNALTKRLDALSQQADGFQTEITDEVAKNDRSAAEKIAKLAQNGDEVSSIQRQILEQLDKRLTELEIFKSEDRTKIDQHVQRMFTLEIKTEKLIPMTQDMIDKQEHHRKNVEKVLYETRMYRERFAQHAKQTDEAIQSHEKALEDKEKRLRVIEVPYESDASRFEKLEAQIAALKYPVMDIYSKIDEQAQATTENQKKLRELSDEVASLISRIDKLDNSVANNEEARKSQEGPIMDDI